MITPAPKPEPPPDPIKPRRSPWRGRGGSGYLRRRGVPIDAALGLLCLGRVVGAWHGAGRGASNRGGVSAGR